MIKRIALAIAAFVLGANPVIASSSTVSVDAGVLTTHNGASLLPVGNLLLLIGSEGGTGTNGGGPSSFPDAPGGSFLGSFVGGDNVILASFAMNNSGSVSGETFNSPITITYTTVGGVAAPSTFDVGDKVALRWYLTIH